MTSAVYRPRVRPHLHHLLASGVVHLVYEATRLFMRRQINISKCFRNHCGPRIHKMQISDAHLISVSFLPFHGPLKYSQTPTNYQRTAGSSVVKRTWWCELRCSCEGAGLYRQPMRKHKIIYLFLSLYWWGREKTLKKFVLDEQWLT